VHHEDTAQPEWEKCSEAEKNRCLPYDQNQNIKAGKAQNMGSKSVFENE